MLHCKVQHRVRHANEEYKAGEEGSVESAQYGDCLHFEGDPGSLEFDFLEFPRLLLEELGWFLLVLGGGAAEIGVVAFVFNCRVKLLILHCPLLRFVLLFHH